MKMGSLRHQGAWFLENRGTAAPEELTNQLLDRLPADEGVWRAIAGRYKLQLRFGLFLSSRNQMLDLSPTLVTRIARIHACVIFDIYGPEGHGRYRSSNDAQRRS